MEDVRHRQADKVKKATTMVTAAVVGSGPLKIGIVAANNHYAGFGPATANTFRQMIGLPERQFASTEKGQSKLTDFGLSAHILKTIAKYPKVL